MSRPWVIWTFLAVCALLILGAMGWLTQRVLGLEEERAVSEAEAEIEVRVRLALSRMDTAASSFLLVENQRPPAHYEPFYRPEDVYTNEYQNVSPGIVLQPSPLLGEIPEFVRLHFELNTDRSLSSPQVPKGNQRDLAEASGIGRGPLASASDALARLMALLRKPSAFGDSAARTNMDTVCLACVPSTVTWNDVPSGESDDEAPVSQQQRAIAQQALNSSEYQREVSMVDKQKRAEAWGITANKAAESSSKVFPARGVQVGSRSDAESDVVMLDQAAVPPLPGVAPPAGGSPFGGEAGVAPFQPVWIEDELFAVREVRSGDGIRYQGVWIDARALSGHLLATIDDLFPGGTLQRIEAVASDSIPGALEARLRELQADSRALVTLPWRLLPGESAMMPVLGWTPLRVSLAVGWVAVVLALLAAAALVRGVMKMSDRRAAFVSSVTHELRTPLTSFQLYADMLADGMVPSEAKRQEYMNVLRGEAGRLNHLIENVLSYSRIERGSARARHETLPLSELLDHFRPRLEDRVGREGARLEVTEERGCEDAELHTDLTAVEQIVFNLVDNACKYGLPEEGERIIRIRACNGGRMARIEVSDDGSGIPPGDRRKLFRPFHKSARDAAHSKPGVGLGLALCKRLAGALGGDLRIGPPRDNGACFVLELPARRIAS